MVGGPLMLLTGAIILIAAFGTVGFRRFWLEMREHDAANTARWAWEDAQRKKVK